MTDSDRVNVLLVDDQPAKLLSYEVILQGLGENLIKASSATDALEHLLKTEIAVVLVDVCMPGFDGFELAAMIREHPRCQRTAIIFISAIHLADVDLMRGYQMGAVDYVPVPIIPDLLRAKVKVFVELYRKTRQLEQLNSELEQRVAERTAELQSYAGRLLQSEHRRNLALAAGKMGSWDWDLINGDCMWDEGQCLIFGVDPRTFKATPESIKTLLEADDWERLQQAWIAARENGGAYETEFRVRQPNGELRWCLGTAAASVDASNHIVRVSGVTIDITDRKLAEDRQAFLAREVDHRARNVLAVVQSVLHLTKTETIEDYASAVEGRISALARAHMLLSECRWEGADLRRLLYEELDPYRTGEVNRIVTVGPDVLLEPRLAQTVALAIHELATNAAKYGSLTAPSGKVSLKWAIERNSLAVEWAEAEGPAVQVPATQGYGTRVIKGSIEQLGGRAEFDWRREGVRCTLSVPLSRKGRLLRTSSPPRSKAKMKSRMSAGNRVLLVEDESLVAMMLGEVLRELGFSVIGPCATAAEATATIGSTDVSAAILDVNLDGELVYPVADLLAAQDIPFAFITGYSEESLSPRYADVPVLKKPIDRKALHDLFVAGRSG
jgi:two-component sensor histidine kinase/DNA-binding response OmpR family regulator